MASINPNIQKYAPDEIIISLFNINTNHVLIITNPYHPGWKAYVDGLERKIFPVNHAFWGVKVNTNDKKIIFRYEPNYKKGILSLR